MKKAFVYFKRSKRMILVLKLRKEVIQLTILLFDLHEESMLEHLTVLYHQACSVTLLQSKCSKIKVSCRTTTLPFRCILPIKVEIQEVISLTQEYLPTNNSLIQHNKCIKWTCSWTHTCKWTLNSIKWWQLNREDSWCNKCKQKMKLDSKFDQALRDRLERLKRWKLNKKKLPFQLLRNQERRLKAIIKKKLSNKKDQRRTSSNPIKLKLEMQATIYSSHLKLQWISTQIIRTSLWMLFQKCSRVSFSKSPFNRFLLWLTLNYIHI